MMNDESRIAGLHASRFTLHALALRSSFITLRSSFPVLPSALTLALTLCMLLLMDRALHYRMQLLLLQFARRRGIALVLYYLILFPGVLLHELSHYLAATVLLVRTYGFSVWPKFGKDDSLELGAVTVERTDFLRQTLIGAAPLLVGATAVILIGTWRLNFGDLLAAVSLGDFDGIRAALIALWQHDDAWLWLYLMFCIGNSLLPSASDRRSWPLTTLGVAVIVGVLAFVGLGSLAAQLLAGPVDWAARALATAFALITLLDLLVLPFLWLLERGAARLFGDAQFVNS